MQTEFQHEMKWTAVLITAAINSFMTGALSNRNQSIDLQSKLMNWCLFNKMSFSKKFPLEIHENSHRTILENNFFEINWKQVFVSF